MIKKLQHKFALSERGAKDLIQGIIACALQNISFMFPVALLYFFVSDLLNSGIKPEKNMVLYFRLYHSTCSNFCSNLLAIQFNLSCNICRNRHKKDYTC